MHWFRVGYTVFGWDTLVLGETHWVLCGIHWFWVGHTSFVWDALGWDALVLGRTH